MSAPTYFLQQSVSVIVLLGVPRQRAETCASDIADTSWSSTALKRSPGFTAPLRSAAPPGTRPVTSKGPEAALCGRRNHSPTDPSALRVIVAVMFGMSSCCSAVPRDCSWCGALLPLLPLLCCCCCCSSWCCDFQNRLSPYSRCRQGSHVA